MVDKKKKINKHKINLLLFYFYPTIPTVSPGSVKHLDMRFMVMEGWDLNINGQYGQHLERGMSTRKKQKKQKQKVKSRFAKGHHAS